MLVGCMLSKRCGFHVDRKSLERMRVDVSAFTQEKPSGLRFSSSISRSADTQKNGTSLKMPEKITVRQTPQMKACASAALFFLLSVERGFAFPAACEATEK